MFCSNCGIELPGYVLYCPECGEKVEETEKDSKAVYREPSFVPEETEAKTMGYEAVDAKEKIGYERQNLEILETGKNKEEQNKNKSKLYWLILIVAVVVLGGAIIGRSLIGEKFDASGYVKACLDLVTKGEKEDYMKLTQRTEEEAEEDYQANMDLLMSDIESMGISEDLQDKYQAFYEELLKKTKYDVKEAKEDGDNFTVDVEIEQITGVFNGVQDELYAEAEAYGQQLAESGEMPSDEEINEWAFNKLYEILTAKLAQATYNETQTVTVHVVLNDNTWEIPQDDYDVLDAALVDLGDLE